MQMTLKEPVVAAVPDGGTAAHESKLRLIEQCPLFQDLAKSVRRELAVRALDVTFPASAVLFQAGEPATVAYVLVNGWVRLSTTPAEKHATVVGPAELSCWPAVLAKTVHASTAKAVGSVRALAFDRADFEDMFERVPRLVRNALYLLAGRVCELQERHVDLASGPAPQRLARILLQLSRPQAGQSQQDVSDVLLSRAELAQIAGSSMFTVSRLLSVWDREGLVAAGRGRVRVENPQQLRRIAEAELSRSFRKR